MSAPSSSDGELSQPAEQEQNPLLLQPLHRAERLPPTSPPLPPASRTLSEPSSTYLHVPSEKQGHDQGLDSLGLHPLSRAARFELATPKQPPPAESCHHNQSLQPKTGTVPTPHSFFETVFGNKTSPISLSELLGPLPQHSRMAVDCRTRTQAYSRQYGRKSSGKSTGSSSYAGDGSAVRIFDHRRNPADLENQEVTEVASPTSFNDVLTWFDALLGEARATPPLSTPQLGSTFDRSSRVCLLFLDEKRCAKILNEEFPMAKLQERLRIDDWNPAHYMSAFCRFPTPIDIGDDEEELAARLWEWRYCISHPFDWDMLWVYLPTTRTSIGIIRTWFDGYDDNFVDMENAVVNFPGRSLAHPMLLGLLSLQVLTADTMLNVREKGNRLFEAQKMTGFHNYRRLRETDGDTLDSIGSDLGLVTKEVLGAASNLTGWENAATQLGRYARFVVAEAQRFETYRLETQSFETERARGATTTTTKTMLTTTTKTADGVSRRLSRYLEHQANKLSGDLDGAFHDARAWLETAQFLLQGVLNLVSQHDANVNIALAKDSKKIAQESKRDSTSMTAIAVVTMFFLPGTFTASFFALPYFQDALPAFWVYWAVTIPLTIAVLLVWVVYTKYINPPISKLEKRLAKERALDGQGGGQHGATVNARPGLQIKSWKILSRRSTSMRDKAAEMS